MDDTRREPAHTVSDDDVWVTISDEIAAHYADHFRVTP
jgi:hypothetical protein